MKTLVHIVQDHLLDDKPHAAKSSPRAAQHKKCHFSVDGLRISFMCLTVDAVEIIYSVAP